MLIKNIKHYVKQKNIMIFSNVLKLQSLKVDNLEISQILKSYEIWILNYKRECLDKQITKLFFKHNISYPKIGFYDIWDCGIVLHTQNQNFIFINKSLEFNKNFFKDLKKLGLIRNFTSGSDLISFKIKESHQKILNMIGFDLSELESRECNLFMIEEKSVVFFKIDNSICFILPKSYSYYFIELVENLSKEINSISNPEIELEECYNFLIKRDA